MTKEAKLRVAIAKDVLKWITPKNVNSGTGYVCSNKEGTSSLLGDKDSKKVAVKLQKKCSVCAKGALLLSVVAKYNEFDFAATNMDDNYIAIDHAALKDRLTEFFDPGQLDLIEVAFESTEPPNERDKEYYTVSNFKAQQFGGKYSKDITRLRKIMQNIIDNDGEFIP